MVSFIDEHRTRYGVEPICTELPIAPSTYQRHKACDADPGLASKRHRKDQALIGHIRRIWEENFQVYGVRKVWHQLVREGVQVARCTVECLMRQLGLLRSYPRSKALHNGQRPKSKAGAGLGKT